MTAPRDDDDDDDGLDGFDSLHAMIGAARAGGFDEEPAPRIDALLMAAARQHAPRPRAAWWARLADWMRPAFAHPALAGAAALVIVGGAAGVMYRRGQHHVAAPAPPVVRTTGTYRDAPPPPPDETIATVPTRPELDKNAPPVEVLQPELPAHHGEAHPIGGRRTTTAPGPAGVRPPDGAPGAGQGSARGGLLIAEGPIGDVIAADRPDPSMNGEKLDVPDDERGDAFAAQLGNTQGAVPTVPRPNDTKTTSAPPPTGTEGRVFEDEAPTVGSGADRDSRDQSRAQAEQLLAQARTAARAKNCAAVKVMAARVRKLDSAYFRDVFSRDADVTRCL